MLNYYLNPRRAEREFFRDFFAPSFFSTNANTATMRTDVTEKENEYLLEVELAGYNKEDIKLSLEDGYLKIEATKTIENSNEENEKRYIRKERYYGSQSRSYYVGNIDEKLIKASFNNGILEVSVPKEEMVIEDKTKYIAID